MCQQEPEDIVDNPPVNPWRRIRVALIALALLMTLGLLALFPAVYFGLRSPGLMNRFIPEIETMIERQTGLRVHFGALSIDLFNHVYLETVKIEHIPGVESEYIELDSVKAYFAPKELFRKKLIVNLVELSGLNAKIMLEEHQSSDQENVQKNSDQTTSLDLNNLLRQLPYSATVENFDFKHLSIDLTVRSQSFGTRLIVDDAGFSGKIDINPGQVMLSVRSDLSGEKNLFSHKSVTEDHQAGGLEISSLFNISALVNVNISSDDRLTIQIEPVQTTVTLRDTKFNQINSQSHVTKFNAQKISSEILFSVKSDARSERDTDLSDSWVSQIFPLTFEVDQKLLINDLTFFKDDGSQKIQSDSRSVSIATHSAGVQDQMSDLISQLTGTVTGETTIKGLNLIVESEVGRKEVTSQDFVLNTDLKAHKGEFSGSQKIEASEMGLPGLSRLIHPQVTLTQRVDLADQQFSLRVRPEPDSPNLLEFDVELSGLLKTLNPKVSGQLQIRLPEKSWEIHPELTLLFAKLGHHAEMNANFDFEAVLKGVLLGENGLSLQNIKWLSGQMRQSLSAGRKPLTSEKDPGFIHTEGLTTDSKFKWSENLVSVDSVINSPSVWLKDLGTLQGLDTRVEIRGNSGLTPDDLRMKVRGTLDSLDALALSGQSDIPKGLTRDLKFLGSFSMKNQDEVRVHQLSLQAGSKEMLTLDTDLSGTLSDKTILSRGKIGFSELVAEKFSSSGRSGLAWDVTVKNGESFNLKPVVYFENFSLRGDDFKLSNVNGTFRIFESFRLTPQNMIVPDHLIKVDPFRRVDVKKVDPFIDKQHLVSVEALELGPVRVGPVRASGTIEQNTLNIPEFELKLFGGYGAGELYFDFHPKQMKVSLKGMLTGIDPKKMMVQGPDENSGAVSGDSFIDAHLAMFVDLKHNLAEGQINITKIGRAQLFALLDLADPKDENEQISALRSALTLSAPTLVVMNFYQGLMDLDVRLDGLAGSLKVREIPVSAFINTYGESMNQLLLKIPMS